ncbi:MAG: hypothetical protein A2Y03_06410 [Omnitrophica WOR_2 bacterium GWF2_38_59]|nr:MAG: hypothetical protein A2Y06_07975 [Omnitrophica WOR_2 bacterium GWA2_37_7]OGX26872.1 MAG: hypothetical protein A2Y03_06410 [Omnitrophica WOR_2 bacterium GWF2_38_59]OGX46789.1 MAG: hypothetical protein A2243_07415 [Omnitrophica WOR_2 bacterium RIFOXYA2_FULL_38_17]OGX59240.1 MAG: hypothetical protein A2447_06090 [Omnitrophica WOR_2 bacterium RIFOXYC2_FULL_38_12]OGX60374.1 MAG: hypothetical protein A2306_00695 [Omnitrophica WOR_2 bacterium RIFOXYB2_FULL_38_16]HBG61151.1 zinc ribbon domain-
MKFCRECKHSVSEQAFTCPQCGAPYPYKEKWDGWGLEYKSEAMIGDWPLVHVSFKYRSNMMPVPARGIIAIGQFGIGIINISQFGVGIVSIGQFTVGVFALAQFALAYSLIAQIGIYIHYGFGQAVWSLLELIR